METDCRAIQETLVEIAGDEGRLDKAARAHLEHCTTCAQVAAGELGLGSVFDRAAPPDDRDLQRQIVAALKKARLRRRILALLPVAASLLVALTGAAMIGGLPGGSLLTLLPHWSSQGWLTVVSSLQDAQIALSAAAASASTLLPRGVPLGALLLALGGLSAIAVTVSRWRRSPSLERGNRSGSGSNG